MREVPCPSCGTTLEVDDRYALFAVCESCDSSVVLDQDAARIHGKMGALAPPAGVLYLGATGGLRGKRFRVIGRVRYGYSRGYWNEWLLSLEDSGSAWISEDEDELIEEELGPAGALPVTWASFSPGDRLPVGAETFHVDEKETAVCEGAEGVLPFPVQYGAEVPYVELSCGEVFATIEFDPEGPRLFRGSRLAPGELRVDVSREEAGVGPDAVTQGVAGAAERVVLGQGASRSITCDSCAAPLEVPAAGAGTHECEYCGTVLDLSLRRPECASCGKSVPVRGGSAVKAATCPHCQALVDVSSDTTVLLISLAGKNRPSVPIRVGAEGMLFERLFRVIGHMRLVERDSWGTYTSNEFLLRGADGEDAWLVLEDGHYSLKDELHERPDVDPRRLEEEDTFFWDGHTWEVDDKSEGASESIDWVEGEFTWVPQVGDRSSYMEAESPPYTLIAEWSATEMEWYRARYVSPAEVAAGFGVRVDTLSRPSGHKAGAPSALQWPESRPALKRTFVLGILCILVGAFGQVLQPELGEVEVTRRDFLPADVLKQASALHARWEALEEAEGHLAQARLDLRELEKVQEVLGGSPNPRWKALLEKARSTLISALTTALPKAYAALGEPVPAIATPPTAADIQAAETALGAARTAHEQRRLQLPAVGATLPETWPAKEIPLADPPTGGYVVRAEAALDGDWFHYQVESPEGPVLSRTLLPDFVSAGTATYTDAVGAPLPRSGATDAPVVRVRGAPGKRGSDRVSLPAHPDATVRFEVTDGARSGQPAVLGACFFFVWWMLEVAFRVLQIIGYSARVAASTVQDVLS